MREKNPWKACDIRGVFPDEVSPDLFYDVGSAVGSFLEPGSRVLIAGDFRLSTPELLASLADGILASGIHVMDAGQAPTPVAYFAHHHWKTDAILIVTASHNPADYNGLKMMIGEIPPADEDWNRIRRATGAAKRPGLPRGSRTFADPAPPYQEWIWKRWRHLGGSMRVVLDAGSGAWSRMAPVIFESLGFQVEQLWCEIDGSFSFRPPDCARAENLNALRDRVQQVNADVGFAWDGDGDRLAVVAPDGAVVTADQLSILLIRHLLNRQPGQNIVCDIKLSDSVRRTVLEQGGTPILERSGHSFIKRRMIESDCLFGCELSGHYFYRELRGGDDGLFSALQVVEVICGLGGWAKAREYIPPMFVTPDLRLGVDPVFRDTLVARLSAAIRPDRQWTLDGIKMQNSDGFVLVRQSVTEPLITMRIEGSSKEGLDRLVRHCAENLPDDVRSQFSEQLYLTE